MQTRVPVVVLGLLWAGLSFARSMGRLGVEVSGISMHPHEFGVRCRYLSEVHRVEGDAAALAALREESGDRPVLLPERDDHVEFVLRHWDDVHDLYRLPMPDNPEVTRRLRRKETLPEEAARAGVPCPADGHGRLRGDAARARPAAAVPAEAGRGPALRRLVRPEGHRGRDAGRSWSSPGGRRKARGFDTVVQELIPEAHEKIWSLFAYIGRSGRTLATVTGVKVRQGPIRFGTSAVFRTQPAPRIRELGLKLLETSGYQGFGHVEFAHDHRDDEFKLLEVNTRVPMWAGVAMSRYFDMARIAYDDLCGEPEPEPRHFEGELLWSFLAKDLHASLAMARRRELGPRAFLRPYLHRHKVRAVMAKDDPLPALAVVPYLTQKL